MLISQEAICIYEWTFNITFNAYFHRGFLFIWRTRKLECHHWIFLSLFSYDFLFSLSKTPSESLLATIFARIRDKSEVEKQKKGNFSWAIVRENQTDRGLQVSCKDFCAKANVLYSGSSTKALRKHESSMNKTVCLSLLPAGSSSQTKFRKYMFGFNSESYDNDYFLISQTLEAAKTQDKQERVIFFVCHKRMSHFLIQYLLRNLNLDVIKLQKIQEQLGCEF